MEDPQGTIITWDESFSDSLNTLPCPFGPPSATATRTCTARLTWGSQNTENCATIVTEEFESLINSLAEVNDYTKHYNLLGYKIIVFFLQKGEC